MLSKSFIYAAFIILSPAAFAVSEKVLRDKRSDDFIPCEKGWYYFREKCYRVGGKKPSERLTSYEAASRCNNFGGEIVSIHSQEEQDFIVYLLLLDLKLPAWIGLFDQSVTGVQPVYRKSNYRWRDDSVFNYTSWKKWEPDNESCGLMVFEPENDVIGKWIIKRCEERNAYICQMNPNERRKSPNKMYCSSEKSRGWKFQNTCYHLVTEKKSWQSAENHCKDNYNGHLVTILDVTTDLFLNYILENINKELWIGVKIQNQLQQQWSSGWHVSYDGFNKEHGNFADGMCALWKKRKEWPVAPCSKKYSFICEVSKVIPPVLKMPAKASHCPKLGNWRDLGGEDCYYFETANSYNWYSAYVRCRMRGGNLVSLHSKEESDILHPFVRYTQRTIFIGLYKLMDKDNEFAWSDGSLINYKNWNYDEPNNAEERCVEISTDNMTWNDCICEDEKGYICSVKKIPSNSPSDSSCCSSEVSLKVLIGVSISIILVNNFTGSSRILLPTLPV